MTAAFGAAALSAAAACPAANAAEVNAPAKSTAEHHAKPHGHPPSRRSPYVYRATIGAQVSTTSNNMFCSGSAIRFVGVNVDPEPGDAAEPLWERTPSAWKHRFTFVAGPATTISVPWDTAQEKREAEEHGRNVPNPKGVWATAPARRICAATTANAGLASVGEAVVTWRLSARAKSVAALLAQTPANVAINELATGFHIEADGTVPAFSPVS
jgi:hypothetical protein